MLRLLIVALALTLLAGYAPAADKKPSRRGQIAYANERNERAAKEAKRRASSAQQQAKWQVNDRRKEVKRLQADTVQSKDRSFTKAHKREIKERQRMAERHKAVFVMDSTPDPNPDSTPKPKQRGMLGSTPEKKD